MLRVLGLPTRIPDRTYVIWRLGLEISDTGSRVIGGVKSFHTCEDQHSGIMPTTMTGMEGTLLSDVMEAEVEASSADGSKPDKNSKPAEPPKQDYIHVRARRGQATDSHSLAERARRERISERMKILQDLVPGCNKVIGKALVLDEIINYIQSLQQQVEFLSMKLEAVNSRINVNPSFEGFHSKDPIDGAGMIFGSQTAREYAQGLHPEWLQMHVGGNFERAT
ncbi:hypothetical protein GOBAR_DD32726 [Gossypium barbadense]|nr:hypothetical protein GOBAR_DD32726 [Gossypium barbadense]